MNLSIFLFVMGCILILIGYVNSITDEDTKYTVEYLPRDIWDSMLHNSVI